ncbi:NTP/NDP exchange transporter Tlc4 [Rickettsia prowazekii]|uniref:ADP,ATP carrier protein 4 n=2 Tax=Rickettsia prowazekii TaxID=782 RepID=TLCD_RICPR|nr:NTP/NDP exchange transporter Tlc4 [Rickettsia prowazekii]Q9ZD47.1 RecName: Full=ADP,ATP carrier protein 4; AltName: Full=ADP/ATP translocase 4 [Rickettsia prowazekii str. Madrid E]EOB09868.1 ADP,ATP carrier protein 4 [Rickettsia prowazekii str. GvF12]ADE30029.1 ATP/ADP translocase [Rickettsia prowazekii str. Rp22]AFE49307.1 ADP,ATP carrier protein [Rickettsia prowazekii str. Chernikova]AFE50152.1 ADP,ATP carrier protein [Rickettsia prowazekii str. Katsinyian]AFE50998.1 ADP,ATP carrier prot
MTINASNIENSFSKINSHFSKLTDYIWPIKRHEISKFLFITLLMFCILFIQNLIRALKDSIVTTMIGAETISFLKFWGVMPSAFLITVIYVKLVNRMKAENIFYLIISIFLTFFALFAYVIFPNHEMLHLRPVTVHNLTASLPNLKWFILLLSKWSFSLFYIIAELWPNVVFALLFWQFVNNITTVEESKRFYPLFGLLSQTGIYLAGHFLENLSNINYYVTNKFALQSSFHTLSIQIILTIVLILGIVSIKTFWLLNHKVLDKKHMALLRFKTKNKSITIAKSFQMILSSRHIRLIATLLICYGIAINLVEGPWKAAATKIYKTPTEYAAFIGSYLSYTGVFTIFFVLLGSNIVRRMGWFTSAVITPSIVFITGILFFAVNNFEGFAGLIIANFILTDPALVAITIGAIQNVLSKSSKYTLFDSTKEMAYVPLEPEIKISGKAAADVIGTKLGKSGSAFLQSLIFIILPSASYQSISICLMIIFILTCVTWIWATKELNKEYKNSIKFSQK